MSDTDEEPTLSRTAFWVFKDPDPGFTQTCISMAANFVLSTMVTYGVTGRGKLSYFVGLATIPCSVLLSVRDTEKDFEKWKELKLMRVKGVPERFLPFKCKYDWTDHEKKKLQKDLRRME